MKKYIKPVMESETFVTNEFVSACGGINSTYKCEDMGTDSNNFSAIYLDENDNKIYDEGIDTAYTYKSTSVTYQDDCGQNGGAVHTITSTTDLDVVFIFPSTGSGYTKAYVVDHTEEKKNHNGGTTTTTRPHFISFTTYNHS